MECLLPSHWDSRGPRCMMKRVYYKADVDKLLERSLVLDSWDDAWEVQQAIFDRIKVHCRWAQTDKFLDGATGPGRAKLECTQVSWSRPVPEQFAAVMRFGPAGPSIPRDEGRPRTKKRERKRSG